jgi:molybdopterin-guanine dinucleotide biosynthesis protein A
VYPHGGPLGGIYTGLLAARFQRSIVVACDMPFLNVDLLQHMISLSRGFDAVVPRLNEKMMEPLHAVYSRGCLNGMREMLEHNDLRVSYFLSGVRVRYVERDECERFDPRLLSFFNINYQPDLDRARALLEEQA